MVYHLLWWVQSYGNRTMFESFKKKKKPKAAEFATDFATKFIEGQLILGCFSDRYLTSQDVVNDLFLLGYVYGVSDCTMQMMCVEDGHEGVVCMAAICLNLFGKDAAADAVGRMTDLGMTMDDFPEFARGVTVGGNEAREILNAAVEKTESPTKIGLLKHLRTIDFQDEQ